MSQANPAPLKLRTGLAPGLLIASAVCYGVFLGWPVGEDARGWQVWLDVIETLRELSDPVARQASLWENNLATASFVVGSLLSVSGPLLFPVLRRWRAGWWVTMLLAIMAVVGLSPLIQALAREGPLRGLWWFMAALVCHLAGLVCVRGPVGSRKTV